MMAGDLRREKVILLTMNVRLAAIVLFTAAIGRSFGWLRRGARVVERGWADVKLGSDSNQVVFAGQASRDAVA